MPYILSGFILGGVSGICPTGGPNRDVSPAGPSPACEVRLRYTAPVRAATPQSRPDPSMFQKYSRRRRPGPCHQSGFRH